MTKTKVCLTCEIEKSVNDFYSDKSHKDGLGSSCKNCKKLYAKTYRVDDYSKELIRAGKLETKYGISLEQYDILFEQQNGLCAICKQPETKKSTLGATYRLSVDHSHKTKKVRGLLCKRCNIILGQLEVDDKGIELLQAAIEYVEKY